MASLICLPVSTRVAITGFSRISVKVARPAAKETVSLVEARGRLRAFEEQSPGRLWDAATLAEVIWPDERFQDPGRAARRILNQLLGTSIEWDWQQSKNGPIFGYSLVGLTD